MPQVGTTAEQSRLLLSFDEVADRLTCSGRQVRNLVLSGDLNSVRIGRLHRIAIADLEDYVARLRGDSAHASVQ